jgi:hypothetical protein
MSFQQFLDLGATSERLHAGLHPSGRWRDPVEVICSTCGYREWAPNWEAARTLAARHDWTHNKAGKS